MNYVFDGLGKLIDQAAKLGALSSGSVFAFFDIVLLFYIVWDMRVKKQANELTTQMRIEDAKSDAMLANALEKVVDQIRELRFKIKCLAEEKEDKHD